MSALNLALTHGTTTVSFANSVISLSVRVQLISQPSSTSRPIGCLSVCTLQTATSTCDKLGHVLPGRLHTTHDNPPHPARHRIVANKCLDSVLGSERIHARKYNNRQHSHSTRPLSPCLLAQCRCWAHLAHVCQRRALLPPPSLCSLLLPGLLARPALHRAPGICRAAPAMYRVHLSRQHPASINSIAINVGID